NGTPTFFINGERYDGMHDLKHLLDTLPAQSAQCSAPHLKIVASYSPTLFTALGRCSGHTATTARATMIPIETSMNLCNAMLHGGAERGIRTMMVRVTLA